MSDCLPPKVEKRTSPQHELFFANKSDANRTLELGRR